jgi:small subunit ribosomal protein S6
MAKPAPTYDLMLLLDPNAEEDQRTKILSDVEALIGRHGSLAGRNDYGRRPLTYEIAKKREAEYTLVQFQGPPTLLSDLNRTLRITDGVVRFRIIKLDPGMPPAPDLAQAAPVAEGEQPAEVAL